MTQPNPMPTETEQAAAFLAWKRGETDVQFWEDTFEEKWLPLLQGDEVRKDDILRIRPTPPEPKWRAYTADEIELGMKVRRKDDHQYQSMITGKDSKGAAVFGFGWIPFDLIFREYEHLDGTPCGVREGEG